MSSETPSAEPQDELHLDEQDESRTLRYHLLGPSLTKAGQDKVDQNKVSAYPRPFFESRLLTVSGF